LFQIISLGLELRESSSGKFNEIRGIVPITGTFVRFFNF